MIERGMKNLWRIVAGWLMSFLCISLLHAQAVPPGATPGGALPREGFRYPTPFVYPQASPPSAVEKKIEQIEKDAPRMRVKGFRIIGVDERPEAGISQQAVDALVQRTAEKMVQTVAASGFTISMLETITNVLARFYRERGYFLTRAFIPEQSVRDGIVQINIVEGFLDQVVFSGNKLYSNQLLTEAFQPLIGRSVYKPEIEEILFAVNDFPGLQSSMVFGPGLEPGSAAIELKSTEDSSRTRVALDNHGSSYTGDYRWRLNHQQHNAFGQADLINTNLIMTSSPANSIYASLGYEQPVINHRFAAGGGLELNAFDVGGNLSDLGINGDSEDIYGFMRYYFNRNRSERLSIEAGLHLMSSVSKIGSDVDSKDELTVLYLAGDYAGTSWSGTDVFQTLHVELRIGVDDFLGSMDRNGNGKSGRIGGSEDFAGGGFTKLEYAYSRQYPLSPLSTLIFSLRGQTSSDLLTSMEQFSLGGPDNARAYPVAEALMDKVYVFSVEWQLTASPEVEHGWTNNMQFSVFFDYASGELNDPLKNDDAKVKFNGIGGSLGLHPFKDFSMNAILAFDLGDKPTGEMSWPFFFTLSYDF
jgi:hemolysin activation/secretion protein